MSCYKQNSENVHSERLVTSEHVAPRWVHKDAMIMDRESWLKSIHNSEDKVYSIEYVED